MPLRYRILSRPETVQDLVLASDERFWEGLELLVAGRRGAGIYLLGYAVEMILKVACFMMDGARPYDPVQPRLAPIRSWARLQLPRIRDEQYHSLWFWAHVLRRKRRLLGRRLPSGADAPFMQRVRRIHGIWVVQMRYKPDEAQQREAETLLGDVAWIRNYQSQLVA